MLKLNQVKFYYEYKNHTLPSYFQQNHPNTNNTLREENSDHSFCASFVLHLNTSIHSHNTRGRKNVHVTLTNHEFAKKWRRHNISHTINSVSTGIRRLFTQSMQRITNDLKQLFINRYSQKCQIKNCYIYASKHYISLHN